jgi:predicted Zn-dependent peptidase
VCNIREDKGYTYGIGTLVGELHETGYFLIATEVGKDVKDATLNEIQKELLRLQTEPVGDDELQLVKNYMVGQLLKSADGPYALTDLFMGVEAYGMTLEFYNKTIDAINKITPERILELANKYLKWENMTVVSVG